MGVIFVTHDIGVAVEVADRIAVMYAGRIVEEGQVGAIMGGPLHPYTQGLLAATVHPGMRGKRLTTIPGAPPSLETAPTTCAFAPRCDTGGTGLPGRRAAGDARRAGAHDALHQGDRCVRPGRQPCRMPGTTSHSRDGEASIPCGQ